MFITFISAIIISFIVIYAHKAYKAYCAGQKQAEHMLENNTFYQVLGFLSRMRRDTHEQVWRRVGFTSACSSHLQSHCIVEGNTYDTDGAGEHKAAGSNSTDKD